MILEETVLDHVVLAETAQGEMPSFDTKDGKPYTQAEMVFEGVLLTLDVLGYIPYVSAKMSQCEHLSVYVVSVVAEYMGVRCVMEFRFSDMKLISEGVDRLVGVIVERLCDSYNDFKWERVVHAPV